MGPYGPIGPMGPTGRAGGVDINTIIKPGWGGGARLVGPMDPMGPYAAIWTHVGAAGPMWVHLGLTSNECSICFVKPGSYYFALLLKVGVSYFLFNFRCTSVFV